jgi:hypothetical protein
MFFIFGSPRSGTTLLAQCLNAHPDLAIPHETDFIIPAAFIFDRVPDLGVRREILKLLIPQTAAFASSLGEYLDSADIHRIIEAGALNLAQFLDDIFAAVAHRAGVRLAGDKSPNDLLFLRMLIKVDGIPPGARIVHIVRDVRDVVSSLMERGWVPQIESYFSRFWSGSNLYLHNIFRAKENYHLVKFEEFVTEPARIVAGVCQHLGIDFVPQMLDPDRRHSRYKDVPHHRRLYEQISIAPIGEFRRKMNPDLIAQCEVQGAEAMAVFGYLAEKC